MISWCTHCLKQVIPWPVPTTALLPQHDECEWDQESWTLAWKAAQQLVCIHHRIHHRCTTCIKKHGGPLLTNSSTSGSVSTWSVRVICLYPAMMSGWFWSQNMLFLHLPQKINHTGIESFPALVLFLELVYHFETKSGGSNPSNCRFGRR